MPLPYDLPLVPYGSEGKRIPSWSLTHLILFRLLCSASCQLCRFRASQRLPVTPSARAACDWTSCLIPQFKRLLYPAHIPLSGLPVLWRTSSPGLHGVICTQVRSACWADPHTPLNGSLLSVRLQLKFFVQEILFMHYNLRFEFC